MKSLYITSVERYAGKTAICLAIAKRLQNEGQRVGYLKPLSLQPMMIDNFFADEDARFAKQELGLSAEPWDLSPVVIAPGFLQEHLQQDGELDLMDKVRAAVEKAGAGQDILLLEGGGSLREGYVFGLPTPRVAKEFNSKVLVILQYHDDSSILDDALVAQERLLSGVLGGVLLNRVPNQALGYITHTALPYLEKHNIPVLGILPEVHSLTALSVEELVEILDADVITRFYRPQALVENLSVGAMTTDAALNQFRKTSRKAVITGGDRADIQLAALETSTTCLILTGNIHPSPMVIRLAEEFGVAVLMVRANTMEAITKIEGVHGKTRLGQTAKLRQFEKLIGQYVDWSRMKSILEIGG